MTTFIFQTDFPVQLMPEKFTEFLLQNPFCGISLWGYRRASQIPPETYLIRTPDFAARLCKDTPKAKPILTLSHCRRRANKSNCSQKTGREPETPWIVWGGNYGASKGNQETLPLLSLFPARRHIFNIPHRTSLLLQNKFWQPQEVHRIIQP